MPEDRPTHESHDKPSLRLRQRLHQATGDRDAEAAALADRAGDVSEEDALLAVRRAEGDFGPDEPAEKGDFATPEDAEEAKEERSR
jgi:hypothetical protein